MRNDLLPSSPGDGAEFAICPADDGQTQLSVRVAEETVWLSQRQMAELFQKNPWTIGEHIQHIYQEGELTREATTWKNEMVRTEGTRRVTREVVLYNLDVIISVGYRVHSRRGTQFRQWATRRLREYLLKGFVLNEARLSQGRDGAFEALQARIRAIRASDRQFHQKLTDLFATSLDYDPEHPLARAFCASVRAKLLGAIRGRTAAERIPRRAGADRPEMGLPDRGVPEGLIRKGDAEVASDDLTAEELRRLNLLVEQYLSFAELQARRWKEMRMADWHAKLDAFLRLNDYEVRGQAEKVPAAQAEAKAAHERAKPAARRRSD
jgi:hypothetical protein